MHLDRRFFFNLFLSAGSSLLILALLLRGLTGSLDLELLPRLKAMLVSTGAASLLGYLAAALVQALLRAVRYRILLAATEDEVPSLLHMVLVTISRNMFVDMLPARLGELSYVAMLNRGCTVRAGACLSSLSIAFVFDLIALALLMVLLLAVQLFGAGIQPWLGAALVVVLLVCALLLLFLFPVLRRLIAVLERWSARRSSWLTRPVLLLRQVADLLRETVRAGILNRILLLSLGVRLVKYLGLAWLFAGVVAASGLKDVETGVVPVLIALLSGEAAASLPVPTFMSFGAYEAGGTLALTVLGMGRQAAALVMLVLHVWSQVMDYSLGLLALSGFFFLARFRLFGGRRGRDGKVRWLAVAGVLALLLAGIVLFGLQWRRIGKLGAWSAPRAGVFMERPAAAVHSPVLAGLQGFVVWSSNRFGNHDIVLLSLPEQRLTRLTDHPHTEYYPRISPDGRRIVFCRSQVPWVSQRNPLPWDIYLLDLRTGRERLVARNGNVPSWSDDGTRVRFQRNRNQLVEVDLASGRERIMFESGKNIDLPASVTLEVPVYSDRRQALAVTLRGGRRGTAVIDARGRARMVGGGCQINWAPDGSYLFYVDHGGRLKNAFYRVDPDTLRKSLWFDDPGPWSHEYFPKVANTGDYLVYGASTGGHEHDRADYEIFLWRIGSPPGKAVRLSYYTGNDCWPDIYLRPVPPSRREQ